MSALPAAPSHARALLLEGRCPACAELLPPLLLLRGEPCARCEAPARVAGEADLVRTLGETWKRRAAIAIGVMGLASLLGGFVPLLQAPLFLLGLLLTHVWVVGGALGWLSPARRVCAALTLRLLLVALSVGALVMNVLVAPLAGGSGFILGALGAAFMAFYLWLAQRMCVRRLELDRAGAGLGFGEWAPPAAALLTLLGTCMALGVALVKLHAWISGLDLNPARLLEWL